MFAQAGEDAELAAALRVKGQLLRDLGHAEEATTAFEASIDAAVSAGDRWQEGMSRNFLATALVYEPAPVASAIAACEEHLALVRWGSPGPIGLWASLGELLFQSGRLEEGRELVLKAQEACREAGIPGTLVYCLLAYARLDFMLGAHVAAEPQLREACEIVESLGQRGGLCVAEAELACAIGHRDAVEAERLAKAACHLAAEDDFTAQVGWRRAVGRAPTGVGQKLLEEAAAICAGSDFLNLHAATLEDLANARHDVGDVDGASAALNDALDLYERKGNVICAVRVREALG